MRLFFTFLLFLFSTPLLAQKLNGVVKDAVTRLPIANVQIITITITTLSNSEGRFSLANVKTGDQLALRIMGYETAEINVPAKLTDTIHIYLNQSAINLQEITIKRARNYQLDSLMRRKEYASVFAYKAPSFKDMFITVDPSYRSPFANIATNSTASLLKFNVLSAFSLFSKKNKQTSKLKQTLLKGEADNYVDNLFSKEKVAEVTKLSGQSLIDFMNTYRPSILTLKKMTGYEVTLYIKKCYTEFLKAQH